MHIEDWQGVNNGGLSDNVVLVSRHCPSCQVQRANIMGYQRVMSDLVSVNVQLACKPK
jgi:hypothetical protein